ncbi:MAG: PSD1 and planctomycete cytochrome C domain-containing protein [Verrucomicrobiota bacterium]|nr:PSD1 and planctomycete cytochrome C domain-containing protein [Verrucomicrobiota bacterium]
MKRLSTKIFLTLISLVGTDATEISSDMLFAHKILPMFKAKCLACHGEDPKKIKGDFDMRTYSGLLRGGESEEPSVVPGKPLQSPLYMAVKRDHEDQWEPMPPKENDKLSTEQTDHIRNWIEGGAPWPGPESLSKLLKEKDPWSADGSVKVKTSGGLSEDWTNRKYEESKLWAYQPISKPNLRTNDHPVDALIRARSPEGLSVALSAEALTLIRRVTFDLTGLPPKPREVQAFKMAWEKDRDGAWEDLIDQLLASPHYGEQMARHWLDVVRYADSAGFSNDYPRPHAWRYRDYVVRSFNNDKPYDQFVREQIAGDEIKPKDPDHLIATGFLRMGPWEHTAMSVKAVTRQQYLDDVVNSVGVTFLANELRCAKCHDHKFDPIPTRDYYRMQAIFAPVTFSERKLPWQDFENRIGIKKDHERYQRLIKEKGIRSITSLPEADRPVSQFDKESERAGHSKVNNKRRQQLNYQLKRANPSVFSVINGAPDKIHILKGGSIESPQEEVSPGILSLFEGSEELASLTNNKNGRRKELAKWITSKNNPLTARVIVNRIWQWHFGQGLAGNPNNFGGTGKFPTHPELLDWLAATFIEGDWSVKKIHRYILTSATYQRSASHPDPQALARLDPENISYASFKPRKLTAEELRDSMLAVSGELNPTLGGIPCHPEINEEIAMQPRHIMGSVGPAYQADPLPSQRNRRTLYAERIRTLADPMLEVFNKPGPDLSCERRETATIAPQAFTMLNSPIIRSRALAFAARLQKERPGNINEQVRRAFQLTYHRMPHDIEMKMSLEYLANSKKEHEANQQERVELPKYVVRQMVEEMTGQAFWWVEDLDIYAGPDYVSDLKPWDVGSDTRALGDLCLVLFNSNEFIYIY